MNEKAKQVVLVVYESIREMGDSGIPSGHLYAALMGFFDFDTYSRIIAFLKMAGMVREENHVLYDAKGKAS